MPARPNPARIRVGSQPRPSSRMQILVALSLAYGAAIAILALVHAGGMSTVAIVGALVLGGLWATRGMF